MERRLGWLVIGVAILALVGCRKSTVAIEPYSLVEGGVPHGPVKVRMRHDAPTHQEWKPGTPCVFPFDKEKDDPVQPWLEGPLIAETDAYLSELNDFSKPIRVPFVPLAPSDRPLATSGLIVVLRSARVFHLLLLESGKVKLAHEVEHKAVSHKTNVKPYRHWIEYPDLGDAVQRLQREGVLRGAPERTEASLYYLRHDEGNDESRPEASGDLDHGDFKTLSAIVNALQSAKHASGVPALRLSVQRGYAVWPKIAQLREDHQRRTKPATD